MIKNSIVAFRTQREILGAKYLSLDQKSSSVLVSWNFKHIVRLDNLFISRPALQLDRVSQGANFANAPSHASSVPGEASLAHKRQVCRKIHHVRIHHVRSKYAHIVQGTEPPSQALLDPRKSAHDATGIAHEEPSPQAGITHGL